MVNITLEGTVVQVGYCQFDLQVSDFDFPQFDDWISTNKRLKTPFNGNLITLKTSRYTHGKENLNDKAHVLVKCKVSFYQYAEDPKFKEITNQGVSIVPQYIETKTTKKRNKK